MNNSLQIYDRSGEEAAVQCWLATKRSPATRRAYKQVAEDFLAMYSVKSATIADIQNWLSTIDGKDSTLALYTAVIKSLFTFLHRSGALPMNIGRLITIPRIRSMVGERVIPVEDVTRIVCAAAKDTHNGKRNYLMILLLFYSGIRISELSALKASDLNGNILAVWGKGEKLRHITLPDWIAEELQKFGRRKNPGVSMFGVTSVTVHRALKSAVAEAGLNINISCHWLRHTNATLALKAGASLPVIQQTLGHASLATTSRYLCHIAGDSTSKYLPNLQNTELK